MLFIVVDETMAEPPLAPVFPAVVDELIAIEPPVDDDSFPASDSGTQVQRSSHVKPALHGRDELHEADTTQRPSALQ
jgi:hypothetical protein